MQLYVKTMEKLQQKQLLSYSAATHSSGGLASSGLDLCFNDNMTWEKTFDPRLWRPIWALSPIAQAKPEECENPRGSHTVTITIQWSNVDCQTQTTNKNFEPCEPQKSGLASMESQVTPHSKLHRKPNLVTHDKTSPPMEHWACAEFENVPAEILMWLVRVHNVDLRSTCKFETSFPLEHMLPAWPQLVFV